MVQGARFYTREPGLGLSEEQRRTYIPEHSKYLYYAEDLWVNVPENAGELCPDDLMRIGNVVTCYGATSMHSVLEAVHHRLGAPFPYRIYHSLRCIAKDAYGNVMHDIFLPPGIYPPSGYPLIELVKSVDDNAIDIELADRLIDTHPWQSMSNPGEHDRYYKFAFCMSVVKELEIEGREDEAAVFRTKCRRIARCAIRECLKRHDYDRILEAVKMGLLASAAREYLLEVCQTLEDGSILTAYILESGKRDRRHTFDL